MDVRQHAYALALHTFPTMASYYNVIFSDKFPLSLSTKFQNVYIKAQKNATFI
jgi:hypothetical protein